jgi:hypothetical protein
MPMKLFRTTINTMSNDTRSLLGPANPVPADLYVGSWNDPQGQAACQCIVSTPHQAPTLATLASRRRGDC